MVVASMTTVGFDVDTQLLSDPAYHKQSMWWCPSGTGLSASSNRCGTIDGPDHLGGGLSKTARPDV